MVAKPLKSSPRRGAKSIRPGRKKPVQRLNARTRKSAPPLTPRQVQCLKLVGAGETSASIGRKLDISADVVDEHIAKACKRLRVRTRTQAVLAASLSGFL